MAIANLTELQPNQTGIVLSVGGSGRIRHRFLEMGITDGAEVKVLRYAPLGDPIEVCIRDYCLSLRKEEAREIVLVIPPSIPLINAETGQDYVITQILGGEGVHTSLGERGLRPGTKIRRLQHPGRAVRLSSHGSTNTIGFGIARKVIVESVDGHEKEN